MFNIDVTRMSSKGQIVIPLDMRGEFRDGEKFVVIKSGKHIILKTVQNFDKNIEDDLKFARRTEAAWKKYDKGEFISQSSDDFLKELDKW